MYQLTVLKVVANNLSKPNTLPVNALTELQKKIIPLSMIILQCMCALSAHAQRVTAVRSVCQCACVSVSINQHLTP